MTDLSDAIAATIGPLRARAESLMIDTAEIKRQTGETTNPTTGVVTPTYSPVYSGPARFKAPSTGARDATAGGHTFTVTAPEVHVPVGSCQPQPGDIVTCLTSKYDAGLVGRVHRVVAPPHGSMTTAYRIPLEVVEG